MTEALATMMETETPIDLNLDTLIGSHMCIQANSGAGKSGAIRKVLEITHGRVQHIVIDTEDEFYTLREKFEYLIAGGDNGDCAATVNNAAALALTILETGFSAIVQINSLPFDQRCIFIREFLTALTGAPKRLWRPTLIVLDEAQFYAPQKGYAVSLDAIVSFMMLGRKRGFTGFLATPRPADLSKQATSPVNNWMIGRCGQPADRRSAADALGFTSNSAEARGLRSLVARQFWVFGPALTNEPVLARIAKTQTTIVKAGQATLPTPPAPAAMQKILASLNAAAVVKQDDPAPAEASNEAAKISTPDPLALEAAEKRGYERGSADMLYSVQIKFGHLQDTFGAFAAQIAKETPPEFIDPANRVEPTNFEQAFGGGAELETQARPARADEAATDLTATQKETLHALAWWRRMGHVAPSRKQLGALLGVVPDGSTMRSRLANLSNAGLVEYPQEGTVALTDAGLAAAPPVTVAASLIETIRQTLTPTQRETFDAIPRRGSTITREALGEALDGIEPNGSTMRSRLSELSNRELIFYPKPGLVARQDWVK